MCREIWSVVSKRYLILQSLASFTVLAQHARNPEFRIWDFAMASSYNGEIMELQAKLELFWDQNLGLYSLTKSKASPLDNIDQKQALSESIQIWKFPLGKQTHNDKHKDYLLFSHECVLAERGSVCSYSCPATHSGRHLRKNS